MFLLKMIQIQENINKNLLANPFFLQKVQKFDIRAWEKRLFHDFFSFEISTSNICRISFAIHFSPTVFELAHLKGKFNIKKL